MPAALAVAIMMLILRFGQRGNEEEDDNQAEESEDRPLIVREEDDFSLDGLRSPTGYSSIQENSETASLTGSLRGGSRLSTKMTASMRRRSQAALGSIV